MTSWISFLPFMAAVVVVAISGGVFMPGKWYKSLRKPAWTPPDWLFGPAWTILYFTIAIAGWRIWKAQGWEMALGIWSLNLALNAAWSWLMFGRHLIGAAFADACAMVVTIVAFIATAWPIDQAAAWLFVPYLAWTSFAAALNFSILRLNPKDAHEAVDDDLPPES
jgi:translocator protein